MEAPNASGPGQPGKLRLALLAAPAVLWLAPELFLGRSLYQQDQGLYFVPHRELIARALRAGRLPEWNPAEYGGMPLLVDPNFSPFHPAGWIVDLVPGPLGYGLSTLFCLLAALFGARALALRFGLGPAGASLAGLLYGFSGPVLSLLQTGQGMAGCFVPGLCAATLGLTERPSGPSAVRLALAVTLVLLAGTPEVGGAGLLLAILLGAASADRGTVARVLLRVAGAILLGLLVAAIQILPTALYLRHSARGEDAVARQLAFSLPLLRLPELFISLWSGSLDAPGEPSWLLPPGSSPYVVALHAGLLTGALGLVGPWRRGLTEPLGRRLRWVLAAACLLFVALALGAETRLTALAWRAPPLVWVRYPEKLAVLWPLAAAICAGAGWERLRALSSGSTGPASSARGPRLLLAAGILCALGAVVLSTDSFARWALLQLGPLRAASLLATAAPAGALELCLLGAALVAIGLQLRGSVSPVQASVAVWLLLVIELGAPALRLGASVPAEELSSPTELGKRIAAEVGQPWSFRVDSNPTGLRLADFEALGPSDWIRSRRLLGLRRAALYGSGPALEGIQLARGYSGFSPGRMRALYSSGPAALNLLGVRFGVEYGSGASTYAHLGWRARPDLEAAARLDGAPEAPLPVRVFENPRASERLFFASSLAGPPAGPRTSASGSVSGSGWAGPAGRIVEYEPERVLFQVESSRPTIAILADNALPGWTAKVDGRPAPILVAHGALRAVALEPGSHVVEMRYRTPGLRAGACLSLSGLAICLLLARKRARPGPS